jgi:hypothetical protein
VTKAPIITAAVPGNVNVAITADAFTGIGAFNLTLLYDPLALGYSGAVPNPAFIAGSFVVTSTPASPGYYKITISYPFGNPPVTLANGSTVVTLSFVYTIDNELNYSVLAWSDDGGSCQYKDAANNPLTDTPAADYYKDGLVASQVAPIAYLPVNRFYTSGNFQLDITADNFDNIGTVSLAFEYDPDVIAYLNDFSSDLAGLTVDVHPGTGGNNKIVLGWFGDPATIPDGGLLVSLDFNYISGETALEWLNDGYACEYTDWQYLSLYDSPFTEYYINGFTGPVLAPRIKADTVEALAGSMVTIPARVWDFNNINSMSLTLDYDPDILTFECATILPALAGSFGATVTTPGRLELDWTNAAEKSASDGSAIIFLDFLYNGGPSVLTWYNDGASCQFTHGPSYTPLPDVPTEQFYHNGKTLGAPGPAVWTGGTSSSWNISSNWQSNKLPDNSQDVIINAVPLPSNWPAYAGDLSLGTQCKNITMNGASQMTVTGDITIPAGEAFRISDNGLLKIGGDWINNGVFATGNGTVEFNGSQEGLIPQTVHPGDDLPNFTRSAITGGMTALSGASAGPTGDDSHFDANIGFTFRYLDVNYTQVRINTNGWISLNKSGDDAGSGDNTLLFFAESPTTVLAPWWDDLKADGATQILYKTDGTSPNKIFTVEWKNILTYSSVATTRINFQVMLYETTGVIEFCYGNVIAGVHSPLESASVGVKNTTGGTGCYIEGTTASTCCVISCLRSDNFWPTQNYRFTPPVNSQKEIFWKITVSKESNANLHIQRDTQVLGIAP